ncbi:MAG: helix-turn-helix domain-containing protein [Massilia sp.]
MPALSRGPERADRRVLRTRAALRDAMLALMLRHGWDDITVQNLCAAANIGRSTFYIHFQSKEQLLEGSLDDLRRLLRAPPGAVDEAAPLAFAGGLVAHIDEQRSLFRALIGRRSALPVQLRFQAMVLQLVEEDLARFIPAGWPREATSHYVAGAIVALLAWWVESGEAPGAAALEAQLRRLTLAAIGHA